MAGDVRDMLIDMFKTRPKPWDQMTAAEQSDICKAIDYASREMVKGVVDEIRSEGAEAPVNRPDRPCLPVLDRVAVQPAAALGASPSS